MATAIPFALSAPAPDAIAAEFARRNRRIAADLHVSVDELAALTATTTTLAEAEDLGWVSAEERRLYEGNATLADLRALGYGEDEARAILDEQEQDRACASST